MNDEALERIQTKIAFLESASAELSDVVYQQQMQIQSLKAQIKALAHRLSGAQSEESNRTLEQERPPHY
jgi:SlyX protein